MGKHQDALNDLELMSKQLSEEHFNGKWDKSIKESVADIQELIDLEKTKKPICVKVADRGYGGFIILNVNTISMIHAQSNTVIVNANHGDGHGIIHTDENGIAKIMELVEIVDGTNPSENGGSEK